MDVGVCTGTSDPLGVNVGVGRFVVPHDTVRTITNTMHRDRFIRAHYIVDVDAIA